MQGSGGTQPPDTEAFKRLEGPISLTHYFFTYSNYYIYKKVVKITDSPTKI